MVYLKVVRQTIYRLNYPVRKIFYPKCNYLYNITLIADTVKKQYEQINRCLDKLPTLCKEKIGENTMRILSYQNFLNENDEKIRYNKINSVEQLKIKLNLSQTLLNLVVHNELINSANNNHHLNIYSNIISYNDIPMITYYSVIIEALFTADSNVDHPLNFNKKICSAFDASNLGSDAKEDLEKLSDVFHTLLIDAAVSIIKMKNKRTSIRSGRNLLSHDNYFFLSNPDGMNISCFEKLKLHLRHDPQTKPDQLAKLDKLDKDDCVIWNMHYRDVVYSIKFCYIIKTKDLKIVVNKFKYICRKIIIKSIENQSKTSQAKVINDRKLNQLKKYIHQADILYTFAS